MSVTGSFEASPPDHDDSSCAFELSENERAWVDFIRLITKDADPAPTLRRIQKLRGVFAADVNDPP